MDWRAHITVDPMVCHGQACLKDTRVPVSVILDNLAAGTSQDDILTEYPTVTKAGIEAALAYAAEIAKERVIDVSA